MAVLTAARFITITDALAAAMLALKGASTSGAGDNDTEEPSDDFGCRGRLGDLNATIMAFAEDDYIGMESGIRAAIDKAGYQILVPSIFTSPLAALSAMCADASIDDVTDIDSFASYYNTGDGGPYAALLNPNFATLYEILNGAWPTARNVFSPAVADMGSFAVGDAFVAGDEIDDELYAGAAVLNVVSTGVSGSGLVLVTGNGFDADGNAVTGRSWSRNVSGNATGALTPAVTGDICTKVTGITPASGLSAGTFQIAAAIPGGRSNPPT